MITEQALIDAGYRAWGKSGAAIFKHADNLYQKRLDDERGKKYFITIYMYDWKGTELPQRVISFMPEIQFREHDGKPCIDVIYHTDKDTTVESMEQFFEELWQWHGKSYYEVWE